MYIGSGCVSAYNFVKFQLHSVLLMLAVEGRSYTIQQTRAIDQLLFYVGPPSLTSAQH